MGLTEKMLTNDLAVLKEQLRIAKEGLNFYAKKQLNMIIPASRTEPMDRMIHEDGRKAREILKAIDRVRL